MKNHRQHIVATEFDPIRGAWIYAVVLIAAGAVLSLILAVPVWLRGPETQRVAGACVKLFFSIVCHQDPDRCIFLGGHALAVCGRCTGIYAGFFLGVLIFPRMRPLGAASAPARTMLTLASLPTVVELAFEWIGGMPSSNAVRAATGACLGAAVPFYMLPAFFQLASGWLNKRS